ncbi:GntR family transcriptional regulator [Leptolyngbya sp. AN02str]|uniref:GntR family transcriptional regulator n=1 Tax=Leptolyngbya sp. AN02str TaxID=3423363 RepID=UPI003D317400
MSRFPKSLQRTQPLKEQAYQTLRKMILTGELVPGQRLVEAQLARDLAVSRTPIREALGQLHREALVMSDADQGLQVARFSADDAAHLYECRIALELVSVTEACEHATSGQMRKLQQFVQKAEKLVDANASRLLNFQLLELDYQFHRLIAEMSGNSWLQEILDQIFDKMMLLRIQTIEQNQGVLDVGVEHLAIYDAIAQRNTKAAKQATTQHLKAAKTRVIHELSILAAKPNSADQF